MELTIPNIVANNTNYLKHPKTRAKMKITPETIDRHYNYLCEYGNYGNHTRRDKFKSLRASRSRSPTEIKFPIVFIIMCILVGFHHVTIFSHGYEGFRGKYMIADAVKE